MICSIEECQKEADYHAKGMCWMHYYRIRRNGTTERKNKIREPMNAYQYGKLLAIEKERERIIKLIEEWRNGLLSLYDLPNVVIGIRSINGLIELIKGETK